MSIQVSIITPESSLPILSADHVTVPAFDGEVGFRPGHANFVCLIGEGKLVVKHTTEADDKFIIKGGVASIQNDELKILAESARRFEEVSERQLLERLNAISAGDYEDPVEEAKVKAEAEWIATQLRAAGKSVPASKLLSN